MVIPGERQKFSGCKLVSTTQKYIGELKDNIREGYGVFTYPNSFFRYEGEWHHGVRHGYGKLKMRDGSYYEGEWKHGEIEGMGVRHWNSSGNTYEGEFEDGELNGKGQMVYGNGDVYEGSWCDNKREGEGILTGSNGAVYTGLFHAHRRHGEGKQVYSESEEYDGGWFADMKQGFGVMTFEDGSVYSGQWRANLMHGEGSISHSSGIKYDGLWINGRPATEPTQIEFTEKEIEIEPSGTFSISIQCLTADGDVSAESGRQFRLSGGIKVSTKSNCPSPLKAPVSRGERIKTPFSFEIEPYPLSLKIESPFEESSSPDGGARDRSKSCDKGSPNENVTFATANNNAPEHLQRVIQEDVESPSAMDQFASPINQDKESDFPVVPQVLTVNGCFRLENLMFPALNIQRPVFTPDSVDGARSGGSPNRKGKESRRTINDNADQSRGENREGSGGARKKRQKGVAVDTEAEKVDVRFCKPGDYVVIVEDVTNPPFLGTKLDPAFIHIKVSATLASRRSKSRIK